MVGGDHLDLHVRMILGEVGDREPRRPRPSPRRPGSRVVPTRLSLSTPILTLTSCASAGALARRRRCELRECFSFSYSFFPC